MRRPIQLDQHTIAVLHIFDKTDDFDDLWMGESDNYEIERLNQIVRGAAKQFIAQLKDRACMAFLESLMLELDKEQRKHWGKHSKMRLKIYKKKYGTKSIERTEDGK